MDFFLRAMLNVQKISLYLFMIVKITNFYYFIFGPVAEPHLWLGGHGPFKYIYI